jgi:hypothetical protein
MADFRGNIDHWIKHSEADYFLLFVKAWIPFNAWYVAELPSFKKNDSEIIKELQNNPNSKPRKIIENSLKNADYDSTKFQSHLAELHFQLDRIPVHHNNLRVSFRSLALNENPLKIDKHLDLKENVYKVEKTSSYFQAFIEAKNGKPLLDFKNPIYNLDLLKKDSDFIRLGDRKIQNQIVSMFEKIDPKKPISLVYKSSDKNVALTLKSLNSCKLIDDPTTIAKGCIKILYALRCMLFHGEVEPVNSIRPIYENGYYLLRHIIKQLH